MVDVAGRTLDLVPTGDPPGGWALLREGEVVAELAWARAEKEVRVEVPSGVWRVRFDWGRVVRALVEAPGGSVRLLYAGGLLEGAARARSGGGYLFFTGRDREHGVWQGVDAEGGQGVLRCTHHLRGGLRWEASVAPEPALAGDAWAILVLWGGLRVVEARSPVLRLVLKRVAPRAVDRALAAMVAELAGERYI